MRPGRGNSSAASGTETDTSVSNYPRGNAGVSSNRGKGANTRSDARNESPVPVSKTANGESQNEPAPLEQRDSRKGGYNNRPPVRNGNGGGPRNSQSNARDVENKGGKVSQESVPSAGGSKEQMVNGQN